MRCKIDVSANGRKDVTIRELALVLLGQQREIRRRGLQCGSGRSPALCIGAMAGRTVLVEHVASRSRRGVLHRHYLDDSLLIGSKGQYGNQTN